MYISCLLKYSSCPRLSRLNMLQIKAPHSGLVSVSGKRSGGSHIKKCGCSNSSCGQDKHPSLPPRLVFTQTTCNASKSSISAGVEHASQHSVSRRQLLSGIASVLIWQASPANPLALSTASAASVPGPRTPSPEVAKALDLVLDKNITKSKVGTSCQVQRGYALHNTVCWARYNHPRFPAIQIADVLNTDFRRLDRQFYYGSTLYLKHRPGSSIISMPKYKYLEPLLLWNETQV